MNKAAATQKAGSKERLGTTSIWSRIESKRPLLKLTHVSDGFVGWLMPCYLWR
ncbi:MAG: hypothetical protein CLLPBCKN_005053 [Chroococcidiopsis cubana SAG 39.79]|uniref:Uncharacterized protein n=1 Tax=Chroococcidiopsis cubana SAG 39.79 TaxID=388085 RepID=A0AB37USM9_9CYAN|nr:hypothetical protein [Chroococcidiopsis cubana]MDZ4875633.1 hypothetical protein [Chroococcidiopsis cubana SAG 39.79]RUT14392.1 hypothetical protein DSM107010_04230 [Chroococcidiopsis cubana SAG 39.79]